MRLTVKGRKTIGQYYRAVFLNEDDKPKAKIVSYDFGNGAKLMEHSWRLNNFVRFVEKELINSPEKLVWAGDYADNELPSSITENEIIELCDENSEYWNSETLKQEGINLYFLSNCVKTITHNEIVRDKYNHNFKDIAPLTAKYLVNHDKKEFVNKTKLPKDKDGWRIHPLPLLTCEGNLRGGGDYYGENGKEFVGSWARNKISVVSNINQIPKSYNEIIPNFIYGA